MKYGLLTFAQSENLGDTIQSIAAMQFLPRVDVLIDREGLNKVPAAMHDGIAVIGNAWYAHNVDNWPPSPAIQLLPISMHMSPRAAGSYFSEKNIGYLRSIAPIGVRDEFTLKAASAHGVDAYMSGCLTLTLKSPIAAPRREDIVVCDIGERALAYVKAVARHPVHQLTHFDRPEDDVDDKFLRARRLLIEYAQARCVITTRLHAALPALSFGTPVYLIEAVSDAYRFDGLREHLWHGSEDDFISSSGFDVNKPPANPDSHRKLCSSLIQRVERFVAHSGTQQNGELIAPLRPSGAGQTGQDAEVFGTTMDGKPGAASQAPSGGFEAIQRTEAVLAAELAGTRARTDVLKDQLSDFRKQLEHAQQQLAIAKDQQAESANRIHQLNSQLSAQLADQELLQTATSKLEEALAASRDETAQARNELAMARDANFRIEAGLAAWRGEAERTLTELAKASDAHLRVEAALTLARDEARLREVRIAELERKTADVEAAANARQATLQRALADIQTFRQQAHQDGIRLLAASTEAKQLRADLWRFQHDLEASRQRLASVPWKAVRVYRGVTRFVPRPLIFLLASLVKNPKSDS